MRMADDAPMATSSKKKPRAGKAKVQSRKPAAAKAAPARRKVAPRPAKGRAANAAGAKGKARRDDDEPTRSSPALAEVDAEVLEFIAAIDRFKHENGRPFPSWSEVLLVLRQLGYRRP